MGNANSIPINLSTNNKCLTVNEGNIYEGLQLSANFCNNENNQKFDYNPTTNEIRYGDWCITSGSQIENGHKVELQNCAGTLNQKWQLSNNNILSLDNKMCLILEQNNQVGEVRDCTDTADKFTYNKINPVNNFIPKIIRNNLSIPVGSLPTAQICTLPPHTIIFLGSTGKNIYFLPNTTIQKNGPELRCLGNILKIILGPLTTIIVSYIDTDSIKREIIFKNGSLEHDLIYDMETSFSNDFKNLMSNIIDYHTLNDYQIQIKKIRTLNNIHVDSGSILISNYSGNITSEQIININNFTVPTSNINVNNRETKDYILGPYTVALLDNQYLYNSSSLPLLYESISGINIFRGITNNMIASPLNSGFAIFSVNCDLTGNQSMAIIGNYTANGSNSDIWLRNAVPPSSKYSNPIIHLGINTISSVSLAPYTKVTLFTGDNYSGPYRIIENNSPNQTVFNLCQINFANKTSSVKIDYSGSYIGYGLEASPKITYQYNSYRAACLTPNSNNISNNIRETFETGKSEYKLFWISLIILMIVIIIVLLFMIYKNRKY
ncbi:ricin-type beta-trefoil domain protein [Moumouvirus australiensis]|uniref:Ricin-type beta-trefoil domain protein n=1 Tax=Moumouvirus australiensis TaxID=2109587 RepID=A0A2P1ELR1_9VIRU|nr:ricin-type beta-trefoil domain protein [Moumouvirus australiensis]AVL94831.1 ricin-type beta-trefoil domain protein [Moumouvirus australiensis]